MDKIELEIDLDLDRDLEIKQIQRKESHRIYTAAEKFANPGVDCWPGHSLVPTPLVVFGDLRSFYSAG
jgi:hypothetical protein